MSDRAKDAVQAHADAMRTLGADRPRYSPTWRTFTLWREDESAKGRTLQLDVRHVVSVMESERRHAWGGFNHVATIRLHDGHEFIVDDYRRDVAKVCQERDADVAP